MRPHAHVVGRKSRIMTGNPIHMISAGKTVLWMRASLLDIAKKKENVAGALQTPGKLFRLYRKDCIYPGLFCIRNTAFYLDDFSCPFGENRHK